MTITKQWNPAALNLAIGEAQHMLHLRISAANGDTDAAIRAICELIDAGNHTSVPLSDVSQRQRQAEIISIMAELAYLDLLARATTGSD